MRPNELVVIDLNGNLVRGEGKPSSEIKLHLGIFRGRKDCQAVIHAHPPVATAFTVAGEDIPDNILPEAAMVLGSVVTVPFAYPGTEDVPRSLEPFLEDHKTFLLSHHGAAVMGADLMDAFHRMETLERIATILLNAKLLGKVRPMPNDAFDRLAPQTLNGSLKP
jgi:L-fuculose-phosphate aldolase